MGLLSEGWMQDLSNKYDEHTLHFVQQILSDSYPGQDVSNNLLAPWIAKISKERGAPLNVDSKGLNSIKFAFKVILEYFKATGDAPEVARQLSSKKDKDAFAQAKAGLEEIKALEARAEESLNPEEELKEWIDNGEIRVIGTGSKGSIWVEVLKKEWLHKSACGLQNVNNPSREQKNILFGIECQVTGGGDRGPWTGPSDTSYTLLGKDSEGHYRALLSATANKERGYFYEIKQRANKHLGAESALGWLNLDSDFADFIINNPEGKNIYKFDINPREDEFGNEVSSHRNSRGDLYGAFAEFGYLLNNKRDTLFRILQGKPKTLLYYKELLENTLTPEELLSLTQKVEDVFAEDPEKFIKELGSFLRSQKEETLRILENFDFPSFINDFGEESLLQSINEILLNMNFDKFMEVIYPFINFENFIRRNDRKDLKEFFRRISEKENSPKKFLKILNELTEKHGDAIYETLGNGDKEKGLGSLIGLLATPRLDMHQDYKRAPGAKTFIAQVEEVQRNEDGSPIIDSRTGQPAFRKVSREINPEKYILNPKGIRSFLNKNKNEFEEIFGGEENGKINLLKYIIVNSSEQDRERALKGEKDYYINHYDELYNNGSWPVPGIIEYSKITRKGDGANKSILAHIPKLNPIDPPTHSIFSEPDNINIYEIDKKEFETGKNINDLIKYYVRKVKKGTETSKVIPTIIGIILENGKNSGISNEQLRVLAFEKLSPEKLLKKSLPFSIYKYYIEKVIIRLASMLNIFSKEDIINYIKSEKVSNSEGANERDVNYLINSVNNISMESENLEEHKIRKYVSNLLESSYKQYLSDLRKKKKIEDNLTKKKRPLTPQ